MKRGMFSRLSISFVLLVITSIALAQPSSATEQAIGNPDCVQTEADDFAGLMRTLATTNDDYVFNFLGMQLIKKNNKVFATVTSLKDLEYFLSTLPEHSIKEIRILAHAGSGELVGIDTYSHADKFTQEKVRNKFKKDASIKLIGCAFADGRKGLSAMKDMGERYLAASGGRIIAFSDGSGLGTAFGLEKLFTTSFGDIGSMGPRYEYRINPAGGRDFVKMESLFNDSN